MTDVLDTPQTPPQRWFLRSPHPTADQPVLLCLPYAGGGASTYSNWPSALSGVAEVWAVQLPGRQNRLSEAAFTELPPLLDAVLLALEELGDRPYAIFGHSMGGLIGFELARRLRQMGKPAPEHLFVSAYHSPELVELNSVIGLPSTLLDDAAFVRLVTQSGLLPRRLLEQPEALGTLLPTVRADVRLCEGYVYASEAPLNCPVTVFAGVLDVSLKRTDFLGWREHTTGPFRLHHVLGDHMFVHSMDAYLHDVIREELARTRGDNS